MTDATRADVCAAAIADAFKDDGEIFASPMGLLPMLGVRLAKLTSNPDLVISDGESLFLAVCRRSSRRPTSSRAGSRSARSSTWSPTASGT